MGASELDELPEFGEPALSESERLVLAAFVRGGLVDRRGPDPLRTGAGPDDWGPDQRVRAAFIAWLLSGSVPGTPGYTAKVRLAGARITGRLDLNGARIGAELLLKNCWIDDDWDLTDAKTRAIEAPHCRFRSIQAGQLEVDGSLDLSGSSLVSLMIPGARVAGLVDLSGTKLDNPAKTALQAESFIATQTVSGRGIEVTGEVVLFGASVGGALILDGATLNNPDGVALAANRLTVAHWISCDDGFSATGEVSLVGAVVGGGLSFTGATLDNPGKWALNAQGIDVGYGLFLGSAIDRPGKFHATGGVRLNGARVGGFVCAWDATLDSPGGVALVATGIRVVQDLMLDRSFVATGEVILSNAQIGTALALDGARFTNPGRAALTAERLVADSVRCRDGFTSEGTVSLDGAQVAGGVDFTGAVLDRGAPLILAGLQAASLTVRPATPAHELDLRHAKVGAYRDDPGAWPAVVRLRDFGYDTLDDQERHIVKRRLDWIGRDPDGYSPQPYEQFTALLRRRGQDDDARKVAIARRGRQRAATRYPWRKAWNWFLFVTVGYGYRASLALLWLVGVFLVGTFMSHQQHRAGQIVAVGAHPPAFSSWAYTLDVLVPILDLGQQSSWQPHAAAQIWSVALAGVGWLLTTLVIAALTGLLKRE